MIKLTNLLKEVVISKPSLIYGITQDNKKIDFELDENYNLIINSSKYELKSLTVRDKKTTEIICENNLLTSLDISNLPVLRYLSCSGNKLTSLDISDLPDLGTLHCEDNRLTSLNVSNLPNLDILDCRNNLLTSLSVSDLPNLEFLHCSDNYLRKLTLSNLPNLSYLECTENQLISLDTSTAPNILDLFVDDNVRVIKNKNIKEIVVSKPTQYKKAYGESHSHKEYLKNIESTQQKPDNFLIDISKAKIISSFTGWNVARWSKEAEKDSQNLKVVSRSAITNPPPYLNTPHIEINNPESWEPSSVASRLINKYNKQ